MVKILYSCPHLITAIWGFGKKGDAWLSTDIFKKINIVSGEEQSADLFSDGEEMYLCKHIKNPIFNFKKHYSNKYIDSLGIPGLKKISNMSVKSHEQARCS